MAVPCPGCGREYDVALFAFGRTLDCTCGARVGLEPRRRPLPHPVRFAADAMLGRLARWLRLVGADTWFAPDVDDAELVRCALEEDRVLLTRDRRLLAEWRVPHALWVASERLAEQLREVLDAYPVAWRAGLFTRCPACNARLLPADPAAVRGRVPPRVWREHVRFNRCPGCGRVYWPGSHAARIRAVLERTLDEGAERGGSSP